jgi:hypothetical protein
VKTNLGKSSHTQRIRIQRQETFSEAVSLIHQTFLSGGYDAVITSMLNVVKRLEGSLDDAVAIYYMVASYILKGQKESQNIAKYQTEIINLLKLFFDRSWGGQTAKAYPDSVRSTGEYQKIEAYLCCVAKKFGQNGYSACSEDHCGELTGLSEEAAEALSPSAETSAGTSVAATTCGHSQANFIVQERPAGWKPTNWENYVCQESTGKTVYDHNNPGQIDLNKVCWDRGVYSTDALAQQLGVAGAALELSSAVRPGIDLRGV